MTHEFTIYFDASANPHLISQDKRVKPKIKTNLLQKLIILPYKQKAAAIADIFLCLNIITSKVEAVWIQIK